MRYEKGGQPMLEILSSHWEMHAPAMGRILGFWYLCSDSNLLNILEVQDKNENGGLILCVNLVT